jgi:hypothetical protein
MDQELSVVDTSAATSASMAGSFASFVFFIAFYAYFAVALQTMAKKTNTPNGWMAWIPLLNVYLLLKVGGKPGWWLILLLIPLVNIVILIMVWMAVAERLNKPSWVGILMIIPGANVIVPGYLAFASDNK